MMGGSVSHEFMLLTPVGETLSLSVIPAVTVTGGCGTYH